MGSTSQTGREGEREMYLIVLLLISSAFGRPSSDVEADIAEKVQQLEYIVHFNNETRNLLNSSRLLGSVSADLLAAEQNILEMETELNNLQEVAALINPTNYFPKFNEAKSYLRQTRQELRELAHRTKAEVNNLLDDHDKSNHPVLLTATIDRMKILMKETKERLFEAKKKYNSANEAFDNLIYSLKVQNSITATLLKETEAEFQEDKEYTEILRYNCKIASVVTLGLCSLIHHFVNEVPLKESHVELIDLRAETDRFLDGATILSADVGAAINVMAKELDQINVWEVSAEQVSQNIVTYPEKYLREIQIIRDTFRSGLNDLYTAANQFLANP